jgi:exopolysaccharide biosynthesis predicted pyruvyltransferase EpsI/glycosyltransferase involved in cell wall biosynthesis/peptidoglycan/xylan/chitin deacetylase (PgdA/CDA1 family)/pyruvate-formate lyase-activating enzyme
LKTLTENMPPVITLAATDFTGAENALRPNLAAQLHFDLAQTGADAKMVTLWNRMKLPTIGELKNGNAPLYHLVRGAGAAPNAHFDLGQIADLLNGAGIIHLFDIRGLVDFPTAAPVLRGKKIIWTIENAEQLADADAPAVVGATALEMVIVTPTDQLAAQVKQHSELKKFPVSVIPITTDEQLKFVVLELYLLLYRQCLGLPEKIISAEAFRHLLRVATRSGAVDKALTIYEAHRWNLTINEPAHVLAEVDALIPQAFRQKILAEMSCGDAGDALTIYETHRWNLNIKQSADTWAEIDALIPQALRQKILAVMQSGAIGDALAIYDAHRRNLVVNQPDAALAEFDALIAQTQELLAKQKLAAAPLPSPAISVLVPVYNVEKYLRQCLDSILAQTFADFELIVVDDASPDNCGKICDEYAAKDARVKVIHQPQNEGLPQARKTGFDASRGAYIQFADSDDWLEPDMLAKMFYAAVSGDYALVYSDVWLHQETRSSEMAERVYINLRRSIGDDKIANINESIFQPTKCRWINSVVWNKLYRRSLIMEIEFPQASYAEDRYINCQTLYYADKIGYVPFARYNYRLNPQSLVRDPARKTRNYREYSENLASITRFLREKFGADFAAFSSGISKVQAEIDELKPASRPISAPPVEVEKVLDFSGLTAQFAAKRVELAAEIKKQLAPRLGKQCVLFGLPYYSNIGDSLIWQGTECFLQSIGCEVLYRCGSQTYTAPKNPAPKTVILGMGGGTFGDWWRNEQDFRLKFIADFPDQQIIILPQTVAYLDEALARADAEIMARHKNLTLCARDRDSYALLKKYFKNEILLVPDMVFSIPPEKLANITDNLAKDERRAAALFLKRGDKELNSQIDYAQYLRSTDYEVADWETMTSTPPPELARLQQMINGIKGDPQKAAAADQYALDVFLPMMVKTGVAQLSRYQKIYTTRMHGAILACLLKQPFVLFNNAYGKNANYFKTWFGEMVGAGKILTLHRIVENATRDTEIDIYKFKQLLHLLRVKKVVYLDDFNLRDENHVVLRFDDGAKDLLSAAPLLAEFGYPFEVFVCGDWVNGKSGYLDKNDLTKIVEYGGRLQYHSKTHPKLDEIPAPELENEIACPDELRALDPNGFHWFAYPYWRWNEAVLATVKKHYRGAVSGNGFALLGEQYALGAVRVDQQTNFTRLFEIKDVFKKYIEVHVPVTACNFRCAYCYVGQVQDQNHGVLPQWRYSPETVARALNPERLGGVCEVWLCGAGETLLPPEMPAYIKALLATGHFVGVVSNMSLSPRLAEILTAPAEHLERLFFKCSFHYHELQRKNLLQEFSDNIAKVRAAGCSVTVEITPSDEMIPDIEEIKAFSLAHFGALPQITIARDELHRQHNRDELPRYTHLSLAEYAKVWGQFHSELFDFKSAIFEKKITDFCYAGEWRYWLNLGNGNLFRCGECSERLQNIFTNNNAPLAVSSVGTECSEPHCFQWACLVGIWSCAYPANAYLRRNARPSMRRRQSLADAANGGVFRTKVRRK